MQRILNESIINNVVKMCTKIEANHQNFEIYEN